MTLEYNTNKELEKIFPVLEEYSDWFGCLVRAILYPEVQLFRDSVFSPQSFKAWIEDAEQSAHYEAETISNMTLIHDDLLQACESIMTYVQKQEKPPPADFEELKNIYDSFTGRIRRFERDNALVDSGLDKETGVRSTEAMKEDLKKEMDRRSRRGNPFCIALVRIKNFKEMTILNQDLGLVILQYASGKIKKCMRSFDDAYRTGESEFLLCLRHTEIAGARIALKRLIGLLEDDPFRVESMESNLSMMFCLYEPAAEDSVDNLVENMGLELDKKHNEGEQEIVYYQEVTALERYVDLMEAGNQD